MDRNRPTLYAEAKEAVNPIFVLNVLPDDKKLLLESKQSIAAVTGDIPVETDTDILLTNRVLKRDVGSINSKIFGAFKTGITMSITALASVLTALIITGSFSSTLSQIFTILAIGLCFDIYNTWVTNASIIKWYATRKNENKS